MAEEKKYYVTIKGEKVEVTEEVYRAYVRPIRAEQRRKRREWKCRVRGPKGNLIRCPHDCKTCEYALAGKNATGNMLSLDGIKAAGIEIEDRDFDLEVIFIDKEERKNNKEKLLSGLSYIPLKQSLAIRYSFFEDMTQEEIAKKLGVQQPAVSRLIERGIESLREYFKKN